MVPHPLSTSGDNGFSRLRTHAPTGSVRATPNLERFGQIPLENARPLWSILSILTSQMPNAQPT
jgi:hypothetical protein